MFVHPGEVERPGFTDRVASVTAVNVNLGNEAGPVTAKVVAAEAGMLAFVTPDQPLRSGFGRPRSSARPSAGNWADHRFISARASAKPGNTSPRSHQDQVRAQSKKNLEKLT